MACTFKSGARLLPDTKFAYQGKPWNPRSSTLAWRIVFWSELQRLHGVGRAPNSALTLLRSRWSASAEEDVGAHARQQGRGAFEVDHNLHDLDIGRPPRAARSHAR